MRRLIGIFGGSFDPVHNGHLAVARSLVASGTVDKVVFMVSPHNPLKNAASLMPEAVRLRLACLACEGESHIAASDFEFALPRPSYTWQTLEALHAAHPESTFKLIIGSDNWLIFDRWHRAADILARYGVIIYPRPHYDIGAATLPRGAEYADMPVCDISSTMIRAMRMAHRDVSPYVPSAVNDEIIRSGLYLG